ncbi:MAG: hypothetical protein EPO22_04885, partial [Dehalococcoidia bacterium]
MRASSIAYACAGGDMNVRTAVLLLLIGSVLAIATACGKEQHGPPTATVDLSNVTVDEAYARLSRAMTREGQVLHTRVSVSSEQGSAGQMRPYYTTDFWIDASTKSLREEYRLDPSVDAYDLATQRTLIVVGPYVYTPDDPDEALRSDVKDFCPQNSDPVISYLLECGGIQLRQEAASTRARFDANLEHEGRRAAALVFEVDGEVFRGTFTTYIDPATFLPIARKAEPAEGGGFPRSIAAYEHEFVDAGSLDPSLFDPHSIGYGAEDARATLDAIATEVPVHWLGEEFTPGDGLPELVLVRLYKDDPGYFKEDWKAGGHLVYESPGGLSGVDIFLWTPSEFDAFMRSESGAVLNDPLCVGRSALTVGGGDAEIEDLDLP